MQDFSTYIVNYWFHTRVEAPARGHETFKKIDLENVTRNLCLPNPDITTEFARKNEENPANPEVHPTQYRASNVPLSHVHKFDASPMWLRFSIVEIQAHVCLTARSFNVVFIWISN